MKSETITFRAAGVSYNLFGGEEKKQETEPLNELLFIRLLISPAVGHGSSFCMLCSTTWHLSFFPCIYLYTHFSLVPCPVLSFRFPFLHIGLVINIMKPRVLYTSLFVFVSAPSLRALKWQMPFAVAHVLSPHLFVIFCLLTQLRLLHHF